MADSGHFIDRFREELISDVYLVDPILDSLLQKKLLTYEQYVTVRLQSTPQNKMRELYSYIQVWDDDDKNELYEVLKKHNNPLVKKLEKLRSPLWDTPLNTC